jgi:hypothetical protein
MVPLRALSDLARHRCDAITTRRRPGGHRRLTQQHGIRARKPTGVRAPIAALKLTGPGRRRRELYRTSYRQNGKSTAHYRHPVPCRFSIVSSGARMTETRLREWRGVKPGAASAGAAVTTRLRTSKTEDEVLDEVAALLGSLRRADLAAVARPVADGDRKADVNAQDGYHRPVELAVGRDDHPGQRRPVQAGPACPVRSYRQPGRRRPGDRGPARRPHRRHPDGGTAEGPAQVGTGARRSAAPSPASRPRCSGTGCPR